MIQFNLLPDVKVEYLKAQNARKMVTIISIAITSASLVFLALIYSIHFFKMQHLEALSEDITSINSQLAKQTEVDKKLTVQNQLSSLTKLHEGKPASPRLFDYLNQVTPNKVIGISELKVGYTESTMSISGVSDSLISVNKYVDTLKFTDYVEGGSKPVKAFKGVVLSEFKYETPDEKTGSKDLPASFTIEMTYEPIIFDNTKKVTLQVPSIITTRSSVNQPTELLKPGPEKDVKAGAGVN